MMRPALLSLGFALALASCGRSEPAPSPPPEPASPPEVREPGGPYREAAVALLAQVVDREAGRPGNAWALAHGILAQGAAFKATDGRPAVEVLADDFLQAAQVGGFKGLQPYFPKTDAGGLPVEPHTDLILKTLLEVGIPIEQPLTPREGAPILERLIRGSRLRHDPRLGAKGSAAFERPDDVAWSIQAWCQAVQAGLSASWLTATGEQEHIDTVSLQQLEMLEAETWFMRQAMNEGTTVEKRRQGIFAFTCGGAHLYQAVVACAATGHPSDERVRERLQGLTEIYLWRVGLETALVEQAITQAPQLAALLYNQDVKFLGHLLESVGKAERDGLFTPTTEQRHLLDDAETRLLAHVLQMKNMGVYDEAKLAGLMANDQTRQFYLDVVGDAAHALHGVRIQESLRRARTTTTQP